MSKTGSISTFWNAFLAQNAAWLPVGVELYEAFSFGSEPESATQLAGLVLSGVKTATSTALREYQEAGRRPPQAGDYSIVLDGSGAPVCVMETTEVTIAPFSEVDVSFARDYGEGDRTLIWWLENLRDYYVEEFEANGWEFDDLFPLVCERFRVVWVPNESPEVGNGS